MATLFRDRIEINEVVFNDRASRPLAGLVEWNIDILDLWDSTAEIETSFARIGVIDGEIPGETAAYAGKQYTLSGYVHAEDRETAQAAWDLIVAEVLPRGVDITITRADPLSRFTVTRLNGPKEITKWVGPTAFRWAAQVRAYDPFRYAAEPWTGSTGIAGQATGGRAYPRTYPLAYVVQDNGQSNRLEVLNAGTSATPRWYANLEGPLVSGEWRIVNETTGDLLKVEIDVPAGSILTIDMSAETISIDGAMVTATIVGDFFRLVRGINQLRLFSEYNDVARLSVTAYSAWE